MNPCKRLLAIYMNMAASNKMHKKATVTIAAL